MGHLSDDSISQYCDKEMGPEELEKIIHHLAECAECARRVEVAQALSGLITEAVKRGAAVEQEEGCLDDMQMAEYLDNPDLADVEKSAIEEHLSRCDRCLTILTETKKSVEIDLVEDAPRGFSERMARFAREATIKTKAEDLTGKLADALQNWPDALQESLGPILEQLKSLFHQTFTFPTPCFAPIFGEHRVTLLGPFGKVRYPIIFEWEPLEGAEKYSISVGDDAWSIETTGAGLEVTPDQLSLDFGEEYMWRLATIEHGDVIDEEVAFFSLVSREEQRKLEQIEREIQGIEPEEDRLILWGGILEQEELYVEAIREYARAFAIQASPGIAYRIAACYDRLELEDLRQKWNAKISETDALQHEE